MTPCSAREFIPHDLANTASAVSKACYTAPALLDAIAADATPRLDEYNAHQVHGRFLLYGAFSRKRPPIQLY